jgi:DNA-binding response OmpR family regulator
VHSTDDFNPPQVRTGILKKLSGMRILVVEDEVKVANALKEGLEGEGYEAVVALAGEDGFYRVTTEPFDVILLDVMLPGRDGLEILTKIRKQSIATPVLVLTAGTRCRIALKGSTGAQA